MATFKDQGISINIQLSSFFQRNLISPRWSVIPVRHPLAVLEAGLSFR